MVNGFFSYEHLKAECEFDPLTVSIWFSSFYTSKRGLNFDFQGFWNNSHIGP